MREVVTVQVGGFANFVGSHFWNFQVIDGCLPVSISFHCSRSQRSSASSPAHLLVLPQDELLGLADDPGADPVFSTAALDMDVLYRAGETHQVKAPAHPIACVSVTSGHRVPSLTERCSISSGCGHLLPPFGIGRFSR
jgi:hypothetical protein